MVLNWEGKGNKKWVHTGYFKALNILVASYKIYVHLDWRRTLVQHHIMRHLRQF